MDVKMLGQRIRDIRKSQKPKMSGEKLAELSGVSTVTIYNLEKGKIPEVKLDTIDRIAKALNIPIGLLTDDSLTIEAIRAQSYLRDVIKTHLEGASLAADSGKEYYGISKHINKMAGDDDTNRAKIRKR